MCRFWGKLICPCKTECQRFLFPLCLTCNGWCFPWQVIQPCISAALQEGQDFAKSNKISTTTIRRWMINAGKMICWCFSLHSMCWNGLWLSKGPERWTRQPASQPWPSGSLATRSKGAVKYDPLSSVSSHTCIICPGTMWLSALMPSCVAKAMEVKTWTPVGHTEPASSILSFPRYLPLPIKKNQVRFCIIFGRVWTTVLVIVAVPISFAGHFFKPSCSNESSGWTFEWGSSWSSTEN